MLNRRSVATFALAAALGIAGVSFGAQSASAEVTLKLAHFGAEAHPSHIAAIQMAARVAERTGGSVKIDIFPAKQLGSPPEQLEQTLVGAIDMNLPTQGALDKYVKAFATVMTPFAFKDYADAHRVLDGPFNDWVAPLLEEKGLVLLSNWEYGFRNVTNNVRPINSPADMKGLKMRTPPEVQLVAAMEATGASATQISFSELPNALTQGVVDGQENPIGVIYHYKVYEVQKHLALTRHAYNAMVNVINKASWGKLTSSQQIILREESVAAGNLMRKLVANQEIEELKMLEAKGMKITRPDTAKFKAVMGPAYKKVAEYAGQENMDRFLSLSK
jgi:tripartite ATP-independent transporter DctP family solute receptor